jgi:hypothetical protein
VAVSCPSIGRMSRTSPTTLRDVWNAVPLAGRLALGLAAGLLAGATALRLIGPGEATPSMGSAATSSPRPAPSASSPNTSAAYSDGYRMGSGLLALGIAPVPAGMDSMAEQACVQGIGASVDVQRSLTRDLPQRDEWYRGCRDGVEQRATR